MNVSGPGREIADAIREQADAAARAPKLAEQRQQMNAAMRAAGTRGVEASAAEAVNGGGFDGGSRGSGITPDMTGNASINEWLRGERASPLEGSA